MLTTLTVRLHSCARGALLAVVSLIGACGLGSDEPCAPVAYSVRPDAVTLAVGQRATLVAYRSACGGEPKQLNEVRWDSSNPTRIAVDSLTGEVHGIAAAGAATITARVRVGPGNYQTQPGLRAMVLTNGVNPP